MTATKATPGPWRLKESPHKREFSYFLDAGQDVGSYFIAAVNNGTGPDDANARLIAAAPELLSALSDLLMWLDMNNLSGTKPGGVGPFAYEGTEYSVVTAARDAIAKATA